MTRFIIAALLALTIAGNAAAAEKDIYDENWYTHHLVCGDKKPAEPFLTNLHTYSFIHFTFQNDIDGKQIAEAIAPSSNGALPHQ